MATIAELIHRTLVGREDEAELAAVKDEVLALCSKFAPVPHGRLSGARCRTTSGTTSPSSEPPRSSRC